MQGLQKLQALTKEIEEARAKMKKEGKVAINEAIQSLLENVPGLHAIEWTQYTPYFNDGDPCYFSVHDVHAFIEDPDKVKEWAAKKQEFEERQATLRTLSQEQRDALGERLEDWTEPDPIEDLCKWGGDEGVYVSTYRPEEDLQKYGPEWQQVLDFTKWHGSSATKIRATKKGIEVTEYSHD
jgi:DNA repair exonuclease SbcCD ATPase subunit